MRQEIRTVIRMLVACEILGGSRTTLLRMEREGKITATTISPRCNRYSRENLRTVLSGGK